MSLSQKHISDLKSIGIKVNGSNDTFTLMRSLPNIINDNGRIYYLCVKTRFDNKYNVSYSSSLYGHLMMSMDNDLANGLYSMIFMLYNSRFRKLVNTYWYYMLKINNEYKQKIFDVFDNFLKTNNIPPRCNLSKYTEYADHCTILHSNDGPNEFRNTIEQFYEIFKDVSIGIEVDGIGYAEVDDGLVFALRCKLCIPGVKRTMHITIATTNGLKPYLSNKIEKWKNIDTFKVRCKLEKFTGNG